MLKFFRSSWLFALLICFGCATRAGSPKPREQVFKNFAELIVNETRQCAGVRLRNYFLTSKSCAGDLSSGPTPMVQIQIDAKKETFKLKFTRFSHHQLPYDVAIFIIDGKGLDNNLSVRESPLEKQETLFLAESFENIRVLLVKDPNLDKQSFENERDPFLIEISEKKGFSGAPLIDSEGRLVGIFSKSDRAVKISNIMSLIRQTASSK